MAGNGKIYRDIAVFPSSSSNTEHYVKEDIDTNELSCGCRGWTVKKPGKTRTCRHVRGVEDGTVVEMGGRWLVDDYPTASTPALEPVLVGSKTQETGGSLGDLFKSLEEKGL